MFAADWVARRSSSSNCFVRRSCRRSFFVSLDGAASSPSAADRRKPQHIESKNMIDGLTTLLFYRESKVQSIREKMKGWLVRMNSGSDASWAWHRTDCPPAVSAAEQ